MVITAETKVDCYFVVVKRVLRHFGVAIATECEGK